MLVWTYLTSILFKIYHLRSLFANFYFLCIAGMLHFNCRSASKEVNASQIFSLIVIPVISFTPYLQCILIVIFHHKAYFLGDKSWLANHPDTWANANYSANMPWTWSRYQGRSMIRPGDSGHNITIKMWGTDRPIGILNHTSPEMNGTTK